MNWRELRRKSRLFFVDRGFRMEDKILKITDKKYFMPVMLALLIILQLANITGIIVN